MTQKFVLRGNSLTAYKHSGAGKTATLLTASVPAVLADAAAIGGQVLNFAPGGGTQRSTCYPGFSNSTLTGQISILCRFAVDYSGTPSANVPIMDLNGPKMFSSSAACVKGFQIYHSSAGHLIGNTTNLGGTSVIPNNSDLGAWSPVAGQYYDFVWTWNGSITASSWKLYIDGVLFATANPAQLWVNGDGGHVSIGFGYTYNQVLQSAQKINEYVLWDSVIDPTSGGLNLNGSTRASFVTITGTLDPTNSTDPGIHEVSTGTAYIINGVSLTGDSDEPAQSDVRFGVQYDNNTKTGALVTPALSDVKTGVAGDGGTGTYDGSDRWTDVGIANVRSGSVYKANSVTNNRTGTAAIPTAANVRSGTATDATTGTLVVPTAANVRLGVAVDATVGTLYQNVSVVSELIGQAPPSTAAQILEITQGDTAQLDLKAVIDDALDPMDLTGATFETYIKNTDNSLTTIPNSQHTANADQVTYRGRFLCSILATQSVNFKLGKGREVVTKVTQGSEVKYLHGLKLLTVLQATPTA
jgi:hypothetical protein